LKPPPTAHNVPVNVSVGLELLNEQFGCSDEELYDRFSFDLQVRYALGNQSLNEGEFEIRTLYYFRERLGRYYLRIRINLYWLCSSAVKRNGRAKQSSQCRIFTIE
jgi:hypothetical protein